MGEDESKMKSPRRSARALRHNCETRTTYYAEPFGGDIQQAIIIANVVNIAVTLARGRSEVKRLRC
jgi:hypothetical protein